MNHRLRPYSIVSLVVLLLSPLHGWAGQTARERAWSLLQKGAEDKNNGRRAKAVLALGLVPEDYAARCMAEQALFDNQPEVRRAGAAALGRMNAQLSIPLLKYALRDTDPRVVLSVADALYSLHDPSAYEIFGGVLEGDLKSGEGLIESYSRLVRDPWFLLQKGIEQGVGFIPFGTMAFDAFTTITKDSTSPILIAAAEKLGQDKDPTSAIVLRNAARNRKWRIRAAAATAIAIRTDPALSEAMITLLGDNKDIVRFTAAAGLVRLSKVVGDKENNAALGRGESLERNNECARSNEAVDRGVDDGRAGSLPPHR